MSWNFVMVKVWEGPMGAGGVYRHELFQGEYPESWCELNIVIYELSAILLAVYVLGKTSKMLLLSSQIIRQ